MFDGTKVRDCRESREITTYELAEKLAVSQGLVSAIENNIRLPNANLVKAIADFFGKSIEEFYLPKKE